MPGLDIVLAWVLDKYAPRGKKEVNRKKGETHFEHVLQEMKSFTPFFCSCVVF